MHLQILEEGILGERELFQESLAECHHLTSGKTIQHRSGLLGLASEAILFMKNKKEPDSVYLICPYLKKLLSTRSPLVLRMQIQFLCLRWDILGDSETKSRNMAPGRLTGHKAGRNAAHWLCFTTKGFLQGASQGVLVVKNLPANAEDVRDLGSIPGSGRFLGGGHGNPLQHSCLENHMDRGARQAIVHRVAKELDMTEAT